MRLKFPFILFVMFLFAACANEPGAGEDMPGTLSKEEKIAAISTLEKKAMSSEGQIDRAVAAELLREYQEFYNQFPADTLSARMLFRGADVARGLGKYKKTIELLTTVHDAYPTFKKNDEVAFLIAFTYDENLRDTTKAIAAYNRMIEVHPASPWAEEARNNIRLLQMTEAELLKFLEEKNR